LFYEHPFEAVTVQQIADRCDLAVGTLFYHAPTKTEMFLMVYNLTLEQAIAEGERSESALPPEASAPARVMALALPIARLADSPQAENLTRYHRDLLFGDAMGPHRREGIALVRRLEGDIARALCSTVDCDPGNQLADRAARAVFAALHFHIAAPRTEPGAQAGSIDEGEPLLAAQVEIIVRGFTAKFEEDSLVVDATGNVLAPHSSHAAHHHDSPHEKGS